MVRIEMLAVGRELLIGRTLNTNAQWMGRRLARRGTFLAEITTVDDDLGEIAAGLKGCLARRADFVVVVGGLGPTPDDMTLKGIAKGIGRKLRFNRQALSLIKEHYIRRNLGNIEMTPARKKMATIPMGAEPIRNEAGTAPGVKLELEGTTVFCLPGVPTEMKGIFRESVEPQIASKLGVLRRKYISMKLEGIYESALAPMLEAELRKYPGAYIKSHPRGIKEGKSKIELDIAVVGDDRAETEKSAANVAREMKSEIEAAGGRIISERGTAP